MSRLLYAQSNKQDGNLSFRHGSEEDVLQKRVAFLAKNSISLHDCVFMEIEHGDKITRVGLSDRGSTISSEAFVTADKRIVLFLLTADCFPVSFYDPQKEVIALAHMGWKPTDKELALKVIEEMKSVYGSQPEDIKVFIGPGIHKESYKFVNPMQKQMPNWVDFLTDLPNGETQIDLISYIQDQVMRSGVPQENIKVDPTDTASSEDFFSHYRSVRTGEPEARFVTILGLM